MIRSLRMAMAATLLAAGATAGLAGSAEAATPGCSTIVGLSVEAGNYVTGFRYRHCVDGDEEEWIPLSVSVERYRSPGVWVTVATGPGRAEYRCTGTAYNVYRTTGFPEFAILCS